MSILDCSLRLLVTLTLISSTVLFFEGTGIQAQVGSLPQYEGKFFCMVFLFFKVHAIRLVFVCEEKSTRHIICQS